MWTFDALPLSAVRAAVLMSGAMLVFFGCLAILAIEPLAAPVYGDARHRARMRARAEPVFAHLEPALLHCAGVVTRLPLQNVGPRLSLMLAHAGQPLGLCADELLALCGASALLLGSLLLLAVQLSALHITHAGYGALVAPLLPLLRVRAAVKQRARELDRSLPSAIDLCVLCMSAGCDFPKALALVVADLGAAHRVCREELQRVLDDLTFGATRASALSSLAMRSRSRAVGEFVAALRLADEKGTPLIDTLVIQSTTLRQRRSERAEELAAEAGVKMMAPMLLLVATVMLIVFGPFIVTGAGL